MRIYLIYQKMEKDIKKFVLQFALKFLRNTSWFEEEARGFASQFVEIFSKNELTMKLGLILI